MGRGQGGKSKEETSSWSFRCTGLTSMEQSILKKRASIDLSVHREGATDMNELRAIEVLRSGHMRKECAAGER